MVKEKGVLVPPPKKYKINIVRIQTSSIPAFLFTIPTGSCDMTPVLLSCYPSCIAFNDIIAKFKSQSNTTLLSLCCFDRTESNRVEQRLQRLHIRRFSLKLNSCQESWRPSSTSTTTTTLTRTWSTAMQGKAARRKSVARTQTASIQEDTKERW